MATRGRPPKPLDPDSSSAAFLGAELRAQRQERGLTQQALAVGSEAAAHSEVAGDEDVEPTDRRGLLGAGAAAVLGVAGGAAVPAAAREVDPELPEHCNGLLNLLGRHDEMFGPNDLLAAVRHQLGMIAEQRQAARGELRTRLLRVESRWTEFAAWLSGDAGQLRRRDVWTDRAMRLAREADCPDMVALVNRRLSEWAVQERDARGAVAFAETGLRVRSASAQTRSLCARQAAIGHALGRDATACERRLAEAYSLVEDNDSPAPLWAGEFRCTLDSVRHAEARCWLFMQPRKAIPLYEGVLREWPRDLMRDRGVHQARFARACAAADERDRAEVEGRQALAVARATGSSIAMRELKQLGRVLSAS
jgi:hypothetical protein